LSSSDASATPPNAFVYVASGAYGALRLPADAMLPNVSGVARTKFEIVAYSVVLVGASLLLYALHFFGSVYLAAAIILYAIWMMLVTSAFWFVRVDNITELFSAFYEAARFPVSVYRGWMQILLTFIVPIAFITTFPAAALINKLEPAYAVIAVALALALFLLSAAFWRFALRFYSSASS